MVHSKDARGAPTTSRLRSVNDAPDCDIQTRGQEGPVVTGNIQSLRTIVEREPLHARGEGLGQAQ